MNAVIIIPARYNSKRFCGKSLVNILGKTLIQRVWEKCIQVVDINNVYIATDDNRIEEHCRKNNMSCIMTSTNCKTGTDRVAEAYEKIGKKYQTIINVQGDEPLILPTDIKKVYEEHTKDIFTSCCGMAKINSEEEFRNPNIIKVVTSIDGNLKYASRAPIPTDKKLRFQSAYKQVCIYAFCPSNLFSFRETNRTPLEKIEDIEILRLLEIGCPVKMVEVSDSSISVDIPEDVNKVINFLKENEK